MVMNRIDDSGRVQREDVYVSHAFAAQWGYFPDARQTPHLASATAEHRTVGYAPEESPDTPTLAKPAEPAGDWVEMVKHWTDADGVEHSKTVRVSREFAAAWGYRPEPSN